MRIKIALLLFANFIGWLNAYSQGGNYVLTPKIPLRHPEAGLEIQKINVHQKFEGLFDSSLTLIAPKCYTLNLFHIGNLKNPAGLEFDNNHVLHVIDFDSNGAIYALPALKIFNEYEDYSDTFIKVVDGIYGHSFKIYQGNIYVAEQNRILKCQDLDKDGFYETKEIIVNGEDWPNAISGKFTRSIVIDSIYQKIYVSIGASCNACREDFAGQIESYNLDGSGKKIVARGVRNGMAMVQIILPKLKRLKKITTKQKRWLLMSWPPKMAMPKPNIGWLNDIFLAWGSKKIMRKRLFGTKKQRNKAMRKPNSVWA